MTVGRIILFNKWLWVTPKNEGGGESPKGGGSGRESSSFYSLLECLSFEIKFVCLFYNNYVTS